MFKTTTRFATIAVTVALATLAPAAHADLIGLYKYDNAQNLGLDSSGKGNNLVAGTGAPVAVAGKFGGGVNLDASSDLVSASGAIAGLPVGNSSYTIASWINPDAQSNGARGIAGWGNYGVLNQVIAFRMNGDYSMQNYWWANDLTPVFSTNLTTGTGSDGWHFVAATYDAGTHLNAIYVDGTMVGARYGYGLNAAGGNFAVGKTVNQEYFNGQMDNTSIFNQALTAAQLGKIAANDYSDFGVAVPEPESVLLMGLGLAGIAGMRRRKG